MNFQVGCKEYYTVQYNNRQHNPVKNIFQELTVTPDKRSKCRIILKNGEQIGLFDGERIINPANLAMQATIEGINFIITKKAWKSAPDAF